MIPVNNDGNFILRYSDLPIGENIILTDELGNILGETTIKNISLVFLKDGYESLVQRIEIDTNASADLDFTLSPD